MILYNHLEFLASRMDFLLSPIFSVGDVEGLGLRAPVDEGDMLIIVCLQDEHALSGGMLKVWAFVPLLTKGVGSLFFVSRMGMPTLTFMLKSVPGQACHIGPSSTPLIFGPCTPPRQWCQHMC